MIRINQYNILFLMVFFSGQVLLSQEKTVNTGMLYVSPETEFSTLQEFSNLETGDFYNDGKTFIYGDFHNEGLVDFYLETGLIRFQGAGVQHLKGSGETFFKGLVFDNRSGPAPFQLHSVMSVEGEVFFRNGIIDNSSYGGTFSFGADAVHRGAANSSHIQGPVIKRGSASFEFPIGQNGQLRYAGISGPANNSDSYEAKYFFENSDVHYPHESKTDVILEIDNSEYWTIKPFGAEQELMITLSFDESITSATILKRPQAVRIVRWDEEQQLWVDEGGSIDMANRTITTAVSKFGVFALAAVEVEDLLPCELVVYNAVTPDNDGVNDYFLIDQTNNNGCAQRINVKIFNRWGVKVFETDDYGKGGDIFNGYSQAREAVGNSQLPGGTYFYVLGFDYEDQRGNRRTYSKTGYLYVNNN